MDDTLLERIGGDDSTLTQVVLSYSVLDDSDVASLSSALARNTHVKALFLDGNTFGSAGLRALSSALERHPAIEELWLSDNEAVTDECAPAIAAIVDAVAPLRKLVVSGCELGSEGLAVIRAAAERLNRAGRVLDLDLSNNEALDEDDADQVMSIAASRIALPALGGSGGSSDTGAGEKSRGDPKLARLGAGSRAETEADLRAQVEALEKKLAEAQAGGAGDASKATSASSSMSSLATHRRLRPTDIEFGAKIGSGGFSKIYRGTWLGKEVAIKKLRGEMDPATATAFDREMALLSNLRHPNVLLLLGSTEMDGKIVIVTELMLGGSLYGLLQRYKKNGARLEPRTLKSILLDTALGMCYLHECEPPIIHRDLKSMNILLDEHGRAKVADFGLSRERADNATMTAGLGTPHWLAPEIARRKKYDEKVDVYSFGIMIWEMLTLEVPFSDLDAFTLIGHLIADDAFRPEIPRGSDSSVINLMTSCWDADPARRPSFKEIVSIIKSKLPDQ